MEERTFKVTGTRPWNGVLPGEHFKVNVGPEAGADITEEQANALIDGGHISASTAKSASRINPNAEKEEV